MFKLLINDVPTDFTLEEEITLGDLFRSLEKWATGQSFIISEFLYDGKDYLEENADENAVPLTQLSEVRVTLKSLHLHCLDFLEGIQGHLNLLLEKSEKGILYEETLSLKDNFFFVRESIHKLLGLYRDQDSRSFLKPLDELDLLIFETEALKDPSKRTKNTADLAKKMGTLLKELEFLHFDIYTQALLYESKRMESETNSEIFYKTLLPTYLKELSKVNVEISRLFQTGEDKRAMRWLVILTKGLSFVDDLLKESETSPLAIPSLSKQSISSFREKLQAVLREIEEALQSKDFIAVSDLIEYDLKEILENLVTQNN